jgi:hypothetical protein
MGGRFVSIIQPTGATHDVHAANNYIAEILANGKLEAAVKNVAASKLKHNAKRGQLSLAQLHQKLLNSAASASLQLPNGDAVSAETVPRPPPNVLPSPRLLDPPPQPPMSPCIGRQLVPASRGAQSRSRPPPAPLAA